MGLLLCLACVACAGCKGEGLGARCSVAPKSGLSDELADRSSLPAVVPPVRQRGWLRPKRGQVNFFAQDAKPRKQSQRGRKISYLDNDGNLVKVGSIAQVPPECRGSIVGQAGSLGRGGGYSVLDFAQLPPPPKPVAQTAATQSSATQPSAGPPARATNAPAAGMAARVSVYGTAWCHACKEAREYLTRKGVEFRMRDIEDDTAALAEYTSYGDNKVPLVLIGENAIHGFNPSAIDSALGLR